ncbi:hypothetical protein [Roseobacter sinensis]|uniref:Uncharacterized protein n=1 Tax=Roseobacter sinensis TaxID=2931391 RepID=A0ABT3BB83_9RHOB|nr:hypothetical protein [Roseobacter sp. WL0113]MCV3270846.1 hypothetical protein [Roseobacter sp. WL0113]
MKKTRIQLFKQGFLFFLLGYASPALISIFVVGFRFDYLWAAIINGVVLLCWPVFVPIAVEEAFRKQE